MIKTEIRSLIFNILPRIDKTNKYHNAVIDRAIERVLVEMYQELFAVNPLALLRYTKGYGYATPLTVSLEASTGIYYTTLPASIVSFPDYASGVRRVSAPISGGLTFIPIDSRQFDLLKGGVLPTSSTSRIGYSVGHTRVEYWNITGTILTSGVKMDIIQPFTAYADTDTVLIPETQGGAEKTFIDRVLAILGIIQPRDLKDDNADAVRQESNKK